MATDYGLAKISNGTHYEEHVGEMISLVFGERLGYVGNNQNNVVASIDSAFQLAKVNQTGLDTHTSLQQVDDIRYVKGMGIDVAQLGGVLMSNHLALRQAHQTQVFLTIFILT